jgi:PadR family transcriptional regulator PadR
MSERTHAGDARTDSDAPTTKKTDGYVLGRGETRIPDEDAVILTDGGIVANGGSARMPELSDFRRDILLVLARSGATHGRGLIDDLGCLRDEHIGDSRLYPNLNALVERGLVDKRENRHDNRSHEFELSAAGRAVVRDHAQRVTGCVESLDNTEVGR